MRSSSTSTWEQLLCDSFRIPWCPSWRRRRRMPPRWHCWRKPGNTCRCSGDRRTRRCCCPTSTRGRLPRHHLRQPRPWAPSSWACGSSSGPSSRPDSWPAPTSRQPWPWQQRAPTGHLRRRQPWPHPPPPRPPRRAAQRRRIWGLAPSWVTIRSGLVPTRCLSIRPRRQPRTGPRVLRTLDSSPKKILTEPPKTPTTYPATPPKQFILMWSLSCKNWKGL